MAFDPLKPRPPATPDNEALLRHAQLAGSGRSSSMANSWPWLLRVALLTAVVFAIHLALLNSSSLSLNLRPNVPSTAFTTRTITPAGLTPEITPPTPITAKLNKQTSTKTKPQQTKPRDTPASTSRTPSESPVTSPPPPETPPEPIKEAEVMPALPPIPSSPAARTDESTASTTEASAAAFAAPPAAKYNYNVVFTKNANSNQGTAELNWQNDGDSYALSLTASYFAIPVFIQKSVGQMRPQGLRPTRFSDKRFRKSEVAAHFNHESGKITFSANTPDAVLLDGAQDRASVILQLSGLLAADPAKYPPGATLNLQTVSATEAEPWLFTVNEPETLNLPAGQQIALRITRNPRREFDQKVELWFAPELNHAPVRFRFTETNGDFVDAQLQSTQYLSPLKPN